MNGGIPVIVNTLKSYQQEDEILAVTKALWMLSFDATSRALIKAIPSAIETLRSLRQHPNKDIAKAASGIFWEIDRKRDSSSPGIAFLYRCNQALSHQVN